MNEVKADAAAPAREALVVLPTLPTKVPFTKTEAKSSAEIAIVPESGAPARENTLENVYETNPAGEVLPVTPGAQIQAAPGILERLAPHPPKGYPYSVAPKGQLAGEDAFRQTV